MPGCASPHQRGVEKVAGNVAQTPENNGVWVPMKH